MPHPPTYCPTDDGLLVLAPVGQGARQSEWRCPTEDFADESQIYEDLAGQFLTSSVDAHLITPVHENRPNIWGCGAGRSPHRWGVSTFNNHKPPEKTKIYAFSRTQRGIHHRNGGKG